MGAVDLATGRRAADPAKLEQPRAVGFSAGGGTEVALSAAAEAHGGGAGEPHVRWIR
jgi:hypothetical protein